MLLDPKGVEGVPDGPAGGLPVRSVAESLKASSLPSGLKAYELMKLFESLPSGVTLTSIVALDPRLVRKRFSRGIGKSTGIGGVGLPGGFGGVGGGVNGF